MNIVSKGNIQQTGVKAANLRRLPPRFNVPRFVVVSTKMYRAYLASGEISVRHRRELTEALRGFLKQGRVAVRSSGTAEDMPGLSFAGMYSTTLNISSVSDGIDAVMKSWQSVESPRVREYCRKMNVEIGDMAVIIQHQLEPAVSGVMVTQSPFSISEVLIECCRGLGDKLVSGRVTPARYRIRGGRTIEHKGDDLLSPEQLRKLVDQGKKIERIFKAPQDVEWAIEDGKLYILQTRPVSLHAASQRSRGTVWCNANVRETIPDPVSPMTWSIFDTSFFPGIMIDVFGFPISEEQYRKFRPVEMLSGRLYWNMNNTLAYGKPIGPIIDSIQGDRAIDPQMAAAFRAVELNKVPRILPGYRMFVYSITSIFRLSYYLTLGFFRYGWMSRKIAHANDELEAYCATFSTAEDLAEAVDKVKNWMRLILKRFARRYFGGIFLGSFQLALLSGLLSIRMGKKGEALARKAIIGIIDKTGEMALNINRLASLARRKLRSPNTANLKKLYRRDSEFRVGVDSFMENFGHRGPAEFDIASCNWREDHAMLFQILAAAKNSGEYVHHREDVVRDILKSVKPVERFLLKAFLPRLEATVPLRENGKHYYLKATAKTKDQLLNIGKHLVDQAYIDKLRDIFFLSLHDLEALVSTRMNKKELRGIIARRKKQWNEYQRAHAPEVIYESGERVSSVVKESKVLRGEPLSSGKIKARARIITDFSKIHRLNQGEVLVTHHADPGWTPLFTIASGLIVEVGGVICHAAMVARELGLPALSITGATTLIHDGALVELDADEGRVVIV
ncbi:MAG: PEP/pyruvate-binding domain-containing protein [candidate division WOR-3 bacterium]|jgi:pyruvate,water dikinase